MDESYYDTAYDDNELSMSSGNEEETKFKPSYRIKKGNNKILKAITSLEGKDDLDSLELNLDIGQSTNLSVKGMVADNTEPAIKRKSMENSPSESGRRPKKFHSWDRWPHFRST